MESYSKKFGPTTDYKLCTITPKHTNYTTNNAITSNSDVRKSTKTPIRTPLKLSSAKKKTPHTQVLDDRYIPNRTATNMEASYHLLVNGKDQQENMHNIEHLTDSIKRKLIKETCQGVANEKEKLLHLRTRPIEQDQLYAENIKVLYSSSSSASVNGGMKKNGLMRTVQTAPEKILDAPDFRDDFYLNLIDWSSTNNLAVALNRDLYIWNATNKEISQLFSMNENQPDYITSVCWIQKGNILAIGNSKNVVELWDVNKKSCLRQMKSHQSRVGCLSWNAHLLSAGDRSGQIHNHDVRAAKHHAATLETHSQEVCGLKWNSDGRHLASGANDNLVAIWDLNGSSASATNNGIAPLHVLRDHGAAVKAVAWCPWQNNILATGGGSLDKSIKIWNMYNGGLLQSHDVGSQVSALLWSKNYKELASSHGLQQNQLSIWKYPDMNKVCDLTGHSNRILGMSMSPDEEMVVSVGADETLRFWKCFAFDEKLKKSKDSVDKENFTHTGLTRSIR